MIPKAQHPHPQSLQIVRALKIVTGLPGLGMAAAVQLDAQLCIVAVEIQNITAQRVLAAELRPAKLAVA